MAGHLIELFPCYVTW